MKAIHIKAETMEAKTINLEDNSSDRIDQIHKILDVSTLDFVTKKIEGFPYYFLVDDNGLNKEDFIVSAWSPTQDYILAGDLIISKTNMLGESEALDDEDVERIIRNIDEVLLKTGEYKKILFLD